MQDISVQCSGFKVYRIYPSSLVVLRYTGYIHQVDRVVWKGIQDMYILSRYILFIHIVKWYQGIQDIFIQCSCIKEYRICTFCQVVSRYIGKNLEIIFIGWRHLYYGQLDKSFSKDDILKYLENLYFKKYIQNYEE